LDDLATFKDLEAVKDGKSKQTESQTEDVTSAGGQTDANTDGGYNKVSALELEVVQESNQEV
jgi:hypothetical protein